jgi:hypothetical protein
MKKELGSIIKDEGKNKKENHRDKGTLNPIKTHQGSKREIAAIKSAISLQ